METQTTKPAIDLGNEPFMSADDLDAYSARVKAARAMREAEGQGRAG